MNREHLDEILEAVRRIEYDLQLLRGKGNEWKFDDVEGLYEFKGLVDPFLMRKYAYDLLRESWHLGDGIEHWINAKWKEGSLRTDSSVSTDKGKGPGRAVVRAHVKSSNALQLCGDLANLSKHYRLTRETLTGNGVPRYGDTVYVMNNVGKLDYSAGEGQGQKIRLEEPIPVKITMLVIDAEGSRIGDVIQVACDARDSWFQLLEKLGITFEGVGE